MGKRTDAGVRDALSKIQEVDADVTFGTGDDAATMKGAPGIVRELCEVAEEHDEPTDPWPVDGDGEAVEFVASEVAQRIGEGLVNGIARFYHLRLYRIHYVLRNAPWEKGGKTVLGQMKRPSGLLKNYAAADFIVLLNWEMWQAMNPMQRVALVYHELRHGDSEGKIAPHDFEGFFDELRLFGTATYEDWNALAQAAVKGQDVRHQYSLSLLDGSDR